MNDEEVFLAFVAMVLGAALLAMMLWARTQRLRMLERALERPELDERTRRDLLGELRRPAPLGRLLRVAGDFGRWSFVVGWLGVFLGLGLVAAGRHGDEEAGMVVGLLGFGLLSLPMALRELERRRA